MAFFKDMGKGMSRMGHKMAVAVGRTTETKDINFEQTRTQFKNFESSVTKVHRAAKAYQAALGAFHKAQTTLAQELLALYTEHGAQSPDEPDLSALVGRGRQLADMIDGAKDRSIGVEYDRKVIEPLDKYLKDLKEVDRRISLRGTKLVDMDRHQRKLSTTDQLKHPEEHARETSKVRQFTEEYNNINTALIHDLPVVMLQRNRVLNSVFASCFVLQNDYYTGAAQATSGFVPELGFIDINRGVDYSLLDNLTNLEGPNLASIGGGGGLASSSSSPYDSGYSSAPPASDPYAQSQPAYGAPAAGAYGAPAPAAGGYGAPAPGGYGAPAPGGAPGYGAPAPGGYGAPAPAYGAPAPAAGGYGAPAPAPAAGGYGAPRGAPPGGAGYGAPRGAAPMAPGRGAPPSRGAPPMAGRGGPPPMAGRGAPMPPPSQRRARALYAFAPEEAGELGFNAGDVINIIKADPGAEWIEGELNGQRGLLPASYVQMI